MTETIYALATGNVRAGVAVIRVSGPKAREIICSLCGEPGRPREAVFRKLISSAGQFLDDALVIFFEGPGSFTGEDIAEFQVHGSRAVIQSVLSELSGFDGVRLALPGEFTRRAFENNKLDLTEVEGLADLIASETEAQRVYAQRLVSGQLSEFVTQVRKQIVRAGALLEAVIDFADEEVPVDVSEEVRANLFGVTGSIEDQLRKTVFAEKIRDGFVVTILGKPNLGKSTLLNYLAQRDVAIVSEFAGTTRDFLEVHLDVYGIPVTLVDTAGLRETLDPVEAEGVRRTLSKAKASDLRLHLVEDANNLEEDSVNDIFLVAKSDLQSADERGISGYTGRGVDDLLLEIRNRFEDKVLNAGLVSTERQKNSLKAALDKLNDVLSYMDEDFEYEICSEMIRRVIHDLDMLTGKVDVEDYLEEIFSSFCIGK